jgi:hypothetical protein
VELRRDQVGVAESDSDVKTKRGLSDSDVNWSRLGLRGKEGPRGGMGSIQRRHGVLRACEPPGVLTHC